MFQKDYYQKQADTLKKKLTRRNFDVHICQDFKNAQMTALDLIDSSKTVAFGGSVTLQQSQIIDALNQRKQAVINRDLAETPEERHQLMRQSLLADYYLTSVNGISEDGILVNIDSVGNRVAALSYGPDKVIAFVTMNKIYGNLESTIETVRKKTAPENAFRLGLTTTPCIKTGQCGSCLKEECICSMISLIRRSKIDRRMTILLILENGGI
ncbi:lactate utilization protein [Enterococcus sp. LJL128]|uniref:lactate utilization protein n=1 Tax=Enterococcus sp. LJL51 TaxID=3416656 RepID=UPI003CF1B61A